MSPVADRSLTAMIADFLADLQQANHSSHTLRAYGGDLAQFAAFHADAPSAITAEALRSFWGSLAHLSPASRARKQACLARFLTWAYRHDLLSANPMEKIDRVKREPPLPRGLARQKVETILAAIPTPQKRDRLLFRLILETGLRVGEALGLHVEDLILTPDDERIQVVGKGGKPRTVLLVERADDGVHAAAEALQRDAADGPKRQPLSLDALFAPEPVDGALEKLRANLTLRSLIFRHALRVGVAAALAVAITQTFGLTRGYWVTLTLLLILKPDFGGTRQRVVSRVAGTLLGGLLAAILVQLIWNDAVIDVLLALLGIAAFSQTQGDHGLFTLLLTPFIVLMIESVQPGGLASGADLPLTAVRVLNTGLGGALALLAGTLCWPSWERERLPEQLARTIDANREYFHEVLSVYLDRPKDAAAIRRAREQAQVENANAAAAFQRLLSEPSARRRGADLRARHLQPAVL
jgi:site-specific recombinase XerD